MSDPHRSTSALQFSHFDRVCVCVCLHSPRDLLHITQADDIQVLYSSVVFAILGKGNNSVCTHLASLLIINRISYSLSKLVVCVYLLC